MTDVHRPGGLTLLAVVTIFLGVLALLAPIGFFSMKASEYAPGSIQDPELEETLVAHQDLSNGTLALLTGFALTQGTLLLLSARGYLLCRRVAGFWMGNLASSFSIGVVFLNVYILDDSIAQGSFGRANVVPLALPVLTLLLLNLVFRKSLTR